MSLSNCCVIRVEFCRVGRSVCGSQCGNWSADGVRSSPNGVKRHRTLRRVSPGTSERPTERGPERRRCHMRPHDTARHLTSHVATKQQLCVSSCWLKQQQQQSGHKRQQQPYVQRWRRCRLHFLQWPTNRIVKVIDWLHGTILRLFIRLPIIKARRRLTSLKKYNVVTTTISLHAWQYAYSKFLTGCLHDEANMKQMCWIYTCTTCALSLLHVCFIV